MPKRNTWFFTRPKRFLDTYKLIQLLILIRGVVKKNKWKGNKELILLKKEKMLGQQNFPLS